MKAAHFAMQVLCVKRRGRALNHSSRFYGVVFVSLGGMAKRDNDRGLIVSGDDKELAICAEHFDGLLDGVLGVAEAFVVIFAHGSGAIENDAKDEH